MDLINLPLPAAWQWSAFGLLAPLLGWAASTAPWGRFRASEPVHLWFGTIFCLTLLWGIKASMPSGASFHLLGVSIFTLLAGPQLALIGSALAVAIATAWRDGWWTNAALNTLIMGAVPVFVTAGALRVAERWLPANFFVYVFVVAFFGSGVAMVGAGLFGAAVAILGGGQPANVVVDAYLPYLIALGFGEAMVSGMLTTLLVVYRPAWVTTFDDARYLRGR
jgi:uncharacterized membrane protein